MMEEEYEETPIVSYTPNYDYRWPHSMSLGSLKKKNIKAKVIRTYPLTSDYEEDLFEFQEKTSFGSCRKSGIKILQKATTAPSPNLSDV